MLQLTVCRGDWKAQVAMPSVRASGNRSDRYGQQVEAGAVHERGRIQRSDGASLSHSSDSVEALGATSMAGWFGRSGVRGENRTLTPTPLPMGEGPERWVAPAHYLTVRPERSEAKSKGGG